MHTPGPWGIHEGFIRGRFNADGQVHDVCDPRCVPPEADFLGEMDANAALIVAAPDMLEALELDVVFHSRPFVRDSAIEFRAAGYTGPCDSAAMRTFLHDKKLAALRKAKAP